MAITKTDNLVNVTAFADGVSIKLGDAIKLQPLAYAQDFAGEPAGSIEVPKFAYIGDAELMVEGQPINPTLLTQTSVNVPIKQAGKAVELTDKAVKSAYGDTVGEAENQVITAISNKIEREMFKAFEDAVLVHEATGSALNTDEYFKALEMFGEDLDEAHTVLVNANQARNIRTDNDYKLGSWVGEVVVSNRVPAGEAYIVKQGALGLYMAKEAEVEADRDILAKSTVISVDAMFATHLRDDSKVIKVVFGETV